MSYNALTYLQGLFSTDSADEAAIAIDTGIRIEDLPASWRACFEERAAIMEHEGGHPRERAEALALADTIRAMKTEATTMEQAKPFPKNLFDNRNHEG
ncbi:MAG: hypothetical protein NT031_17270 [Planctomycetota bacterium]|nr:hypothetical protein [Planctomycetota bacterium]